MIQHENELNQHSEGQEYLRICPSFLKRLYIVLKDINILVNEIERIGAEIRTNPSSLSDTPNFIINLNATTSHFDVATISSTKFNGNRVLKIRRKGSPKTTYINVTDNKLEPLSYSLIHPDGENGWGEEIRNL